MVVSKRAAGYRFRESSKSLEYAFLRYIKMTRLTDMVDDMLEYVNLGWSTDDELD